MIPEFLLAASIIFLYMSIVFLIAMAVKDNSIVDIGWGMGFIFVGISTLFYGGDLHLRKVIISLLVLIWGLRLSIHIYLRNKGKREDFRYKNWREKWKYFILRSFFQIFMLQGLFMFIISLPLIYVNKNPNPPMGILDILGIIIFITGFIFETIGDKQLSTFKSKAANKGKIITHGLWKYTRHPNYFGEALLWWGIGIMALSLTGSWWTLFGPLTLSLLLRYVSGVPMLEKKYEGRADFEEYKKSTPVFFPKVF